MITIQKRKVNTIPFSPRTKGIALYISINKKLVRRIYVYEDGKILNLKVMPESNRRRRFCKTCGKPSFGKRCINCVMRI